MYAIVEIAGQQFKVRKDQNVYVHTLQGNEGDKVEFDNVLLIDDNGKVNLGAPAIDGALVTAKILRHLKGDKVIVFKKKRRKGYKVKNGHRQGFTQIQIEGISASGAKKKAAAKKEDKKEAPKKEAPKKEEKPAAKKEAPKKEAAPKTSKGDDLTKIEGIGPKIAEVLAEAGITTYKKLAKTSVDKLNDLLSEAGPSYANKVPDTWHTQAALAADGKWDELEKLQDELDGGVVREDDLTKIEGVGPKISDLLIEAGLDTYAKVAAASVEDIEEILEKGGPTTTGRRCETWAAQAALAAEAKWDELAKMQEELDGGIDKSDDK